jgi:glycosyltransferase involved in cell wall biosynthesis
LNFYLSRYSFIPPQIVDRPSPNLGITVVIPCFNEPNLIASLESLKKCDLPKSDVEVIIVINSGIHHAREIKDQNTKTLHEVNAWITDHSTQRINYFVLFFDDLPMKHAGVGLARKIGMDEAVARFDQLGKDGTVACFDADSLCDGNYLAEIEKHFENHPKSPGCSIYFEHPVSGNEFEERIYEGILHYELHLRYYRIAMRYCGLPYAYHTVGSSMAVRSSAYQKQGGMNKRKAGEDFYFLHKIIALGNFTELNTTRVIPSPRISDRVPFGTGKAIGDWVNSERKEYETYNFESFQLIRGFVQSTRDFYEGRIGFSDNAAFNSFLEAEHFAEGLKEVRANSSSYHSFARRFFVWFDAFKVLKLVHFLRDHGLANLPVTTESLKLLRMVGNLSAPSNEPRSLLMTFRDLDRYPEKK